MKKVVFSITNVRSKSDKKLSGFGYLAEGNLLCPCISKNSKPYIRIFEDVEKRCRPISGRQDVDRSRYYRLSRRRNYAGTSETRRRTIFDKVPRKRTISNRKSNFKSDSLHGTGYHYRFHKKETGRIRT